MSGHPYEDILRLPHPASTRHHPMPNASRAAQFAPFAALTGYEEAVQETARLTEPECEMDEESLRILNERFQEIKERIHEQPEVTLTCNFTDNSAASCIHTLRSSFTFSSNFACVFSSILWSILPLVINIIGLRL